MNRDWHAITVLVNKDHPLPTNFIPNGLILPQVIFTREEYHPRQQLRGEAAIALEKLFTHAAVMGVHLIAASGYRSFETQTKIFAHHVEQLGMKEANRESARPGESEHQTGLAMDVTASSVDCKLVQEFGSTREGEWLAKHAHKSGFILRYPKGKEMVTGYIYEPWHLRYLGENLASQVKHLGLTYEEYLDRNK
ncbi:M15 family metallopeptidase [Marininema halotolerans]|uniref:D-alanyl-D-alanine carboxypeptidase n=1 Tax=Marininema halotolerans TaxID=1155944 RepID=A0A1I6Q1I2_9BACL|nr:M15 family metallopeptidase [Marininema halotolerans]SFS46316.1 D-alanyl-D-alanine carboxypeptidase [Marininema halotolerans]